MNWIGPPWCLPVPSQNVIRLLEFGTQVRPRPIQDFHRRLKIAPENASGARRDPPIGLGRRLERPHTPPVW
jgi:hypothetical protein